MEIHGLIDRDYGNLHAGNFLKVPARRHFTVESAKSTIHSRNPCVMLTLIKISNMPPKPIAIKRRMPVNDLHGHFSDKASFYQYLKEQLYVPRHLTLILFL